MRMRLAGCLIAIALFVFLSAASAVRSSVVVDSRLLSKSASVPGSGSITGSSYRSPGKLHKAIIPTQDLEALAEAKASGAIEIADYGSFKLFALDDGALQSAEKARAIQAAHGLDDTPFSSASSFAVPGLDVRDDMNVLLLRSGPIDTSD